MNHKIIKASAAVSALMAALSMPVSAQTGPGSGGPSMMRGYGPGGGNGGYGPGWHMGGGGPGSWWGGPGAMTSRIDGRLAFLKAELKITEAQSPAWNKFADAVRASSKSMIDRMKTLFSDDRKTLTLPQRIDLQEEFMTARLDEIKQVKATLKDLYTVLNEDQKKEADTLVLPMMGMGMMQGGWGGGGWGMGPGMWNR